MNTESDLDKTVALDEDGLLDNPFDKTVGIVDFSDFGKPETAEEPKPVYGPETAPSAEIPEAPAEELPKQPEPAVTVIPEGPKASGSKKGRKVLAIILTVVLGILGLVLLIAAGPFCLLAFGGIPFLYIFLWPREKK